MINKPSRFKYMVSTIMAAIFLFPAPLPTPSSAPHVGKMNTSRHKDQEGR